MCQAFRQVMAQRLLLVGAGGHFVFVVTSSLIHVFETSGPIGEIDCKHGFARRKFTIANLALLLLLAAG